MYGGDSNGFLTKSIGMLGNISRLLLKLQQKIFVLKVNLIFLCPNICIYISKKALKFFDVACRTAVREGYRSIEEASEGYKSMSKSMMQSRWPRLDNS